MDLRVCDFFLRSSVCGCGVVLMVALWEIGGGNGGVVAEEEGVLSLFSPWTSQASLISLFLTAF